MAGVLLLVGMLNSVNRSMVDLFYAQIYFNPNPFITLLNILYTGFIFLSAVASTGYREYKEKSEKIDRSL